MVIFLVGISGAYTIIHLYDLNRIIDSIIKSDLRAIQLGENALDDLYSMTAAEDKYLVSGDQDYYRQLNEIKKTFNDRVGELEKIADAGAKVQLLTEIKRAANVYYGLIERRDPFIMDNDSGDGDYHNYTADRSRITREIDDHLHKFIKLSVEDRDRKLTQSNKLSTQASFVFNISQSAAIVFVMFITFINARKINMPIKLLGERTKEVAEGKITEPLNIKSPPEIKALADSFNTMCEQLVEADQMKTDYISHLSHELRTPLTVIKEASNMLQAGIFAHAPAKQEELFSLVKTECDRLISTVSRLLDFSQMEAGNMYFSFQPAKLTPLLEKSIAKLSPLIQKQAVKVGVNVPEDVPLLKIDKDRIEQVFENLLSNALKYTPEGGNIAISAKMGGGNSVEVSVSDNGVGIPKERLVQVFDKFKRVDDGRSAVMGTGLGLSIVKHIVNAHGGRVWVKSKVGEGSTFTFSLPVS